jgi:hypothetical protein
VSSCGYCHTSTLVGASSHDFHGLCDGDPNENRLPSPFTCHQDDAAGACDLHDSCNESDDIDIEEVARATQDAVGEVLWEMIEASDRVRFNRDRQAMQVLDCGGHVVAHFPVSVEPAPASKVF